jgi:hypothetical protein
LKVCLPQCSCSDVGLHTPEGLDWTACVAGLSTQITLHSEKKRTPTELRVFLVGVRRTKPPTSSSRTWRYGRLSSSQKATRPILIENLGVNDIPPRLIWPDLLARYLNATESTSAHSSLTKTLRLAQAEPQGTANRQVRNYLGPQIINLNDG